MTQPFSFMTATEILFGRGQAQMAPGRIAALGPHVLLVEGATPARADWLALALIGAGCRVTRFSVPR
ncbi:iron-containing alcohol dehydrogenase, partial [Thioclava sp. BHET1]